jgi:asparagine N-glycosylation enzyme membrane subunit Stt3
MALLTARALSLPALAAFVQSPAKRDDVYNILWVLVFGFATLNILALLARQFDDRRRFSFGEIIAILVVVVAVVLLASELLYQFKIFPIKLSR